MGYSTFIATLLLLILPQSLGFIEMKPSEHIAVHQGHQASIKIAYHGQRRGVLYTRVSDQSVLSVDPTKIIIIPGNQTTTDQWIQVSGKSVGTGTVKVTLRSKEDHLVQFVTETVEVSVVKFTSLAKDFGLYIICILHVTSLFLLGFVVQAPALKAVLFCPRILLLSAVSHILLRPLIMIGCSLSMGSGLHSFIALLVLSCNPSSPLSPFLVLLQHGRLDCSLVGTAVQGLLAFGSFPLWFFLCSRFLHLPHTDVWTPIGPLVTSAAMTFLPLGAGIFFQRQSRCARFIIPVGRSLHPIALATLLVTAALQSYDLWDNVHLVSLSMAASASIIPITCLACSSLMGAVFKLSLPAIKSTAILCGMQNIVLSSVVVRTCFPSAEGSLMAVTVSCAGVASLLAMLFFYFIHVMLWVVSEPYRTQHGDFLTAYNSLATHLVHSMIRAGEISLKRKQPSSPTLSEQALVSADRGFNSLGFGSKVLMSCRETLRHSLATPDTTKDDLSSSGSEGISGTYEIIQAGVKCSPDTIRGHDTSTSFTVSSCSDVECTLEDM